LPDGTLLYIRSETTDHDLIIARDLASGHERVVTDLTGDGSSGWKINGYSLSPDRRRIAIASLYGPTADDVATGLATNAIWTFATDGTDFRRLTPTFPNTGKELLNFSIAVGYPEWTADGSQVVFEFGNYWWEGTTIKGGALPMIISAAGGATPSNFVTSIDCALVRYPSRNPVTGEFLFLHGVCLSGQREGIFLYSKDGAGSPTKLVAGDVYTIMTKEVWFSDGSGFLFSGAVRQTDSKQSLFAYEMATGNISSVVEVPKESWVESMAITPDQSKIVYCLSHDNNADDLHLVDLTVTPPTDTAITNDGKSCNPSF